MPLWSFSPSLFLCLEWLEIRPPSLTMKISHVGRWKSCDKEGGTERDKESTSLMSLYHNCYTRCRLPTPGVGIHNCFSLLCNKLPQTHHLRKTQIYYIMLSVESGVKV